MDDLTDSIDVSLSKIWEAVKDRKPGMLQFTESKELDTTEQQYVDKQESKTNIPKACHNIV